MDEQKTVNRLSRIGILGNVLLAGFKLAAGILGRSSAMVSDAVHSMSDVFATLIAYIGVILSRREDDAEHPVHERFGADNVQLVAWTVLLHEYGEIMDITRPCPEKRLHHIAQLLPGTVVDIGLQLDYPFLIDEASGKAAFLYYHGP